jgi:shikimate dehydrogenase
VTISGRTTLVGLIGDPVDHSLSPRMQNAALRAMGLDWAYVPLRVRADGEGTLEVAVRGLAALSFRGVNVTIPHKRAAFAAVDRVTGVARRAGSVNTIFFEADGSSVGDSTDGLAVVEGLAAAAGPDALPGALAVVLGAGGSARAAVEALASARARVVVVARRQAAAEALVHDLDLPGVEAAAIDPGGSRILVNCTPLGGAAHPAALPDVALEGVTALCDLAYRPDGEPTPLVAAAHRRGVSTVDGLEVLVRQGAASLERWTGMRAPLETMRAALGRD